MECLLLVLFILVIFAIFICLENNGYFERNNKPQIIEGMTDEELLQETWDFSSQGVCSSPSGDRIWPRHEEACTGLTGFDLSFIPIDEKLNKLDTINAPSEVTTREVSLEYGDVVEVKDHDGRFIYRSLDSINLQTETNPIALFNYKEGGNIEYCFKTEGDGIGPIEGVTTKDQCESDPHNGTWLVPTNDGNPNLAAMDDSLKSISCGIDNEDTTPSGIRCFEPDKIKVLDCTLNEGDDIIQVKPSGFWKIIYKTTGTSDNPGSEVRELCEGSPTGHIWEYNSNLNTMADSQQFAERYSQIDDVNITEDNELLLRDYQNRIPLTTDTQELLARQQELKEEILTQSCNFEGNPYHGNISTRYGPSVKLYQCSSSGPLDEPAKNLSENCSSDQLTCDSNFAKPTGIVKQIRCSSNGEFEYLGCQASSCRIPDDFDDKYKFKATSPHASTGLTTINDLKDMVSDELKIECKPGYHGDITITSCIEGQDLIISGCEENLCSVGIHSGYEFSAPIPPSPQSQSVTQLYELNNMNQRYPTTGGPLDFFRCESPNWFHLQESDNTHFQTFLEDVNNSDKTLKDYTTYPSVVCSTDGGDFSYSNCYQNKCHNPKHNKKLYDSSSKPGHFEDTISTSIIGEKNYAKYEYDNDLPSDNTIDTTQLYGKIKCGKSFTKEGIDDSSDSADKMIDNDKIRCYHFYDFYNVHDENNTYAPAYSKGEGIDAKVSFTEFIDWERELGDRIDRTLNFSVGGCQENYCKWPTTSLTYNKPRTRDLDTLPENIQDESGHRYQLGYKLSNGSIEYSSDMPRTARDLVGFDETQSPELVCEDECLDEPTFTRAEIIGMIENVPDETKIKGQPELYGTPHLDEVKRGGPFTISRCWRPVAPVPSLICNGNNCNNAESSECEAQITGCEQNKCTLKPSDATNGTRILIETLNSNGVSEYKSIGGINSDNMDIPSFNVDQIRNITCDFNHSKTGESIITIKCPEDEGEFEITNGCEATQCGDQLKIDGLINLTNHLGDINTVCPNQTWMESHSSFYGENIPPTLSSLMDTSIITSSENCIVDNEDVLVYNKERYVLDGKKYKCNSNTSGYERDNPLYGISSVGSVEEECNYLPDTTEPIRTVSGCQPKLCILPTAPIGYEYNSILTPGSHYSTDSIFNRETRIGGNVFLPGGIYDNLNTNDLITCSSTHSAGGTNQVSLTCEQTSQQLQSGEYNDFVFSGCEENMCTLPGNEELSGYIFSSDFNINAPHTRSEVLENIQCTSDHSINPDNSEAFLCSETGGVFENVDLHCNENTCRIPPDILEDPSTASIHSIRDNLRQENIDGFLDANYPEINREENQALKDYLISVGQPDNQHICYSMLDGEDLSSNECMGNQCGVSSLNQLRCHDSCHGEPVYSCNADGGDFVFSGCSEKYCTLPSSSELDNILYNYGTARTKLQKLADIQEGRITKRQFQKTLDEYGGPLKCATYAQPSGDTEIECNGNGQPFILTGCSHLTQNTDVNYSNGGIIYSYQGADCSGTKENAFIYISGTDVFGSGENAIGSSVTHTLDRSNTSETGEFYYHRNNDGNPEYRSRQPEGFEEGVTDWTKIPMYLNYSIIDGEDSINSNMVKFKNTSKDMCDKISDCHGFSVSQINKLTSEIDTVEKAGARNDEDGTVNIEALRTYLANENNNILEYGTLKSEQKNNSCNQELATDFHKEWGRTTDAGGNSYVYNHYDNQDVLNHRVIPTTSAIFFKKISNEDGSSVGGDENRGYTNADDSEITR